MGVREEKVLNGNVTARMGKSATGATTFVRSSGGNADSARCGLWELV